MTTTDDNFDSEYDWDENTEQEEEEPHERWARQLRGFCAFMFPLLVSGSLGAYLAYLHGQSPPQAWFWGKEDPNAPIVLKQNEMKGRVKAMQYSGNEPCQDRLTC